MTAPPARIADDTWVVSVPMSPIGPGPHQTNCVVLRDQDELHLVDPGEAGDASFGALLAGLAALGLAPERIRTATATHLHHDHLGLAARLRERFGAEILLHRIEQESLAAGETLPVVDESTLDRWGVPAERRPELLAHVRAHADEAPPATVLLENGDRLPLATREVRVLHTPGHTAGHIVLHEPSTGILLTGDHVLFDQYPGVGLGGRSRNALADYLGSLDRTPIDGVGAVVPGHGRQDAPIAERVAAIRTHHRRRSEETAAVALDLREPTVWEVAQRIAWTRGWEQLRGFTLRSALAQVEMHLRLIEAARGD